MGEDEVPNPCAVLASVFFHLTGNDNDNDNDKRITSSSRENLYRGYEPNPSLLPLSCRAVTRSATLARRRFTSPCE